MIDGKIKFQILHIIRICCIIMHVSHLKRRLITMDLWHYEAKLPFSQKHLLTLQDWSGDEILQCLSLALRLKDMQKRGEKADGPCR